MRAGSLGWLLLLVTLGGCAGAAPPFDELPLRDTLRAEPDVVATLSEDARARLSARFQTAGAGDTAADAIAMRASSASGLAAEADRARQARSADSLVIGVVGGGTAQAVPAGTQSAATSPLPRLEGTLAASTADLEARALNGAAGASLRELVAAAHAQRLERVVGWPVAAVAVGDAVYVNGAWLVALAPTTSIARDAGGCGDAGCDGGAPDGGSRGDGGSTADAGAGGRAGRPPVYTPPPYTPPVYTPPVYTPPPYTPPTSDPSTNDLNDAANAADGCAAVADACASAGDGSQDDSCSGQDDGQQSDCSAPTDDGSSSGCRTAPGRGRTSVPTMLWMFAPLAYLLGRKR